jgi:hypothetical protein
MPRNIPAAPPPGMWQSGAPRVLSIGGQTMAEKVA